MAQNGIIPDASLRAAGAPLDMAGRFRTRPLRIGIIGCGAIAEHGYLPAIARIGSVSVTVLIDKRGERAAALAGKWGVPRSEVELGEAAGDFDGAIVALPNHLHAPITCELLKRGIAVLVEKPMALNVAECDRMLAAAREGKAPLGVGFVCRFSRAARMVKELLESGMAGPVRSFHAENGSVFAWPVTSDFLFHKQTAGGGVLIDLGSHVLDLLSWWLGPVEDLTHSDDSAGGVEADSLTHLQLQSGARGTVRLSRTCHLRKRIVLNCERATLHMALDRPALDIRFKPSSMHLAGEVQEGTEGERSQDFVDLLARQLDEWALAVTSGGRFEPDGAAGRRVAAVIERCYAQRQRWALPWLFSQGGPS